MKWILRILCAPVIAILAVFISISALILKMSAWVFGIAATLLGILAVITLIAVSVKSGIILLVMAFLVSPVGIPMIAAWLLGQLQGLRYAIQDKVY